MTFWTLDKNSNTPRLFGSIAIMSKHIGIPANTLYNYFSRNKLTEFENENIRIAKLEIIRSIRENKNENGI